LPVTEPSLGATGWNTWGHDVTTIVNTVETADARLDALEAGAVGAVTSVTAANATVTVGGTGTAPTVAVGTIAESQVTNLVTDLAAKLVKASNLSDLANTATARTNLGLAPIAASGSATNLSTGTVPTARLGSGVASSTTFLRGDQTWATPPSGGGTGWSVFVNDVGGLGDGTTDETTTLQGIINANAGKVLSFNPTGVYLVQQLLLPSNTHLELNGCTIRRIINTTGATNGATIRNTNQGPTSTDVNITVRGGTIDARNDSSGRPWSLNGVTGLRVQDMTIARGAAIFADWMFHFENCTTVRVDNCRVTGGTEVGEDGCHIKSTTDMVVTNCIFEAGDDALVLVHEFDQVRPIKDITISNCVLASQSANALKIAVHADETMAIENVTISNIAIRPPATTPAGNCVTIEDITDTGLLRRVSVSDVVIDATGYPGNAVTILNVVDSEFSNWRIYGASDRSIIVTKGQRLKFTDIVCDTPNGATGNPHWYLTGGCVDIQHIGCVVKAASIQGWVIDTTGTRDISFVGCQALTNTQQAWNITYAARVSLVGCTVRGGSAPIICDATHPPTDLKVVGCNFSGYSGGAVITNPPTTFEYVGNTDDQARGNQLSNTKLGFFGTTPAAKPTVTGAKGGNAALTSLCTQLAALGLITDTTS